MKRKEKKSFSFTKPFPPFARWGGGKGKRKKGGRGEGKERKREGQREKKGQKNQYSFIYMRRAARGNKPRPPC